MPDDCVVFIYHQSIPIRWHLFNYIVPAKDIYHTQTTAKTKRLISESMLRGGFDFDSSLGTERCRQRWFGNQRHAFGKIGEVAHQQVA